MKLSVKDNTTGIETICALSYAASMIGLEDSYLHRKIKALSCFDYKHFTINSKLKIIPNKKRGKSIDQIINK